MRRQSGCSTPKKPAWFHPGAARPQLGAATAFQQRTSQGHARLNTISSGGTHAVILTLLILPRAGKPARGTDETSRQRQEVDSTAGAAVGTATSAAPSAVDCPHR